MSIQKLALTFINDKSNRNFTPLYNRLRPGLLKYVYSICKDFSTCDQIVGNAFAKMWEKIDQYDTFYSFSTWAYRIARNEALLSKRYSKRNYSYDGIISAGGVGIKKDSYEMDIFADEDIDPGKKLHDLTVSVISALPKKYSEVAQMQLLDNEKLTTIAEALGAPLNTIKTRSRKAKQLIKRAIVLNHKIELQEWKEYF